MPLKIWRVSAEWVFDSMKFNEFMAEDDYEVDRAGNVLVHRHILSVEDIDEIASLGIDSETVFNESSRKRKKNGNGSTSSVREEPKKTAKSKKPNKIVEETEENSSSTSKNNILERTHCPVCNISISAKALPRHHLNKHSEDAEKFVCTLCEFKTNRRETLLDHKRRKHFEPVKLGRPSKQDVRQKSRQRKRSPFRLDAFQSRHTITLKTLEANAKLQGIQNEIETTKKTNEERLMALENAFKKKENELSCVKTRITIIESKAKELKLPALKDIPGILDFLNLNQNATKEQIRQTINLRLMELSPESSVSNEIFTNLKTTDDDRQKTLMFLNQASDILIKWKKAQLNH